jgi:SAM-dependent methyltransferase
VTCLEVIEHIVTAELLLQEMARILKDEGKLILSTPNFAFLRDRLVYLVGADAKEEGYHFRFYTQHKLAAMCRAAGFRIEATNSMGSPLGLNFLLRMATLGRCRLAQFSCPQRVDSWLADTFIWRLVKL